MTTRLVGRHRFVAADLVGYGVLVALIGWFLAAGRLSGGDPGPLVAVAALSLLGLLLGSAAAVADPIVAPALVIAAALAVALFSAGDLVGSGPLGGPFGYANATGAFFAQAAIAGVVFAVVARSATLQTLGWAAAAGFAAVVVASRSAAATGLVVLLPLAALVLARGWRPRIAVGLLGALFAAAFGVTMLVGSSYPSGGVVEDTVVSMVGERRAVLWRDAWDIMAEEPLTGAGIGSFQRLSPTARDDADARWAHNEFLELGAETGVPGLILLVLVFAWVFVRLWMGPTDSVAALGAAAAAAIGIHASIDYVLHFPAIPIAAAFLVGSTMGRRRRRGER